MKPALLIFIMSVFNHLSIATFNAAGLTNDHFKITNCFELLKNYDLVCIQETHFTNNDNASFFMQIFERQFRILITHANDETHAGLCILVNLRSRLSIIRKLFEINGRAIGVLLKIDNKKFM